MTAIWCSSFTRLENTPLSNLESTQHASERTLTLSVYLLDQVDPFVIVNTVPNEVNSVIKISQSNLCRMGLISHSLVKVWSGSHSRIAQVQLQTHVADTIVYMSPLLARNLDCKESTDIKIERINLGDIGLNFNAFPKLQSMPAAANRVEISPIMWNSLFSQEHQELIQTALRKYFDTPRILHVGDIFGVPLLKIYPESLNNSANESSILLQADIGFFRVNTIDSNLSSSRAFTVLRNETTLVQTTPVSQRISHERTLRQYILSTISNPPSPNLTLSIYASHLDKLIEWMHPTPLPLPISVVLSGVAGSGKKTLLYNAAAKLGLYVLEVCFSELASNSELQLLENIRQLVKKAQTMKPCILFFNRFFLSESDNEEAELRIGATLMECMKQELDQIPLVVSVEDINDLPVLVRQSFMYELVLDTPSEEERLSVLKQLTVSTAIHPEVELESIAHRTAGRTIGELKALITDAGIHCLENISVEDSIMVDVAMRYQLENEHFDRAIQQQQTKASLGLGSFSIPNVKWQDVGGLEHAKDEILDMVQLPFKHPELFSSGVRQRSGILLYGPPGTGKTLLAKAIATECNMNFISVKGPELLNMYIGESEKNVRQVFQMARNARPCILFFDELDSLAPMRGRGSDSGGVMDRVVSQLLTEIDSNLHQVFVVGATNRPDLIESALLRPGRFDRLLYLGISQDKATQLKVVAALTRKFHFAPTVDLTKVVAQCPLNFTGADFYALCSIALSLAIKDRVTALDLYIETTNKEDVYSERPLHAAMLLEKMSAEELQVQVGQKHFEEALPQVIPSVSASELAHYEKLRRQFSSLQSKA